MCMSRKNWVSNVLLIEQIHSEEIKLSFLKYQILESRPQVFGLYAKNCQKTLSGERRGGGGWGRKKGRGGGEDGKREKKRMGEGELRGSRLGGEGGGRRA